MKKSVNFNGFKAKHRQITAQNLIELYRKMGWTDDQILAEMKRLQEERKQKTPSE